MKNDESTPIELLKVILSNLNSPQALNDHPWASAPQENAGARLTEKTLDAFRRMVPHSPPRAGKRLDTRWGAFGILAAQYFMPFLNGTPFPSSLRDAWDSMDKAILLFVYGKTEGLTEEETARYRFAGNELQPAPNSTLSDWHRKGLEQLAELTLVELTRKSGGTAEKAKGFPVKKVLLGFAALLLLVGAFLGWKAFTFYRQVQVIEQKAEALEKIISAKPQIEDIPQIAGQVRELRIEIDALQTASARYIWMAKYGGWIPTYGGTLKQSEALIAFAQNLSAAADDGLSALAPLVETAIQNDQPVEVLDLMLQINDANPQLLSAQIALAQAQEHRKLIETDLLTPKIQRIIVKRVDPLLNSISGAFPMEDALALASIAPELLGSGKAGPQTYLILMQNEDELRPTGGFLTAVGLAVVKDGELISIKISSSDKLDAFFEKPYPIPPWQFEEFMGVEMFALRDSNWFTDFPRTVSWTEYFYSYTQGASSDGVIALDMQVVSELLKVTGPVRVDSVNIPISSENVQEYLRSAEESKPKGMKKSVWDRKAFIGELAQPILSKILNARGKTWSELTPVILNLLSEKHILLQFDNEKMTNLLERHGWDGAVRVPENSDYVMAVDTNMGYNKTNARMQMSLDYVVDLNRLDQPAGSLKIKWENLSTVDIGCELYATGKYFPRERQSGKILDPIYNMDECHWGYLRVYIPQGVTLIHSNPQEIPAASTWHGETIPARTDDLGDEDIANAQVFGMMTLTPTHSTHVTEFEYDLPARIVTQEKDGAYVYKLRIQKQPGILSHKFNFSIRLPAGAKLESSSLPLTEAAGVLSGTFDLRQDTWIEVRFR